MTEAKSNTPYSLSKAFNEGWLDKAIEQTHQDMLKGIALCRITGLRCEWWCGDCQDKIEGGE